MSEAEREKLLDLVQTLELKLNSLEQVTQRTRKTFQICLVFREKFENGIFYLLRFFLLHFTNEEIRRGTMELEAKTVGVRS